MSENGNNPNSKFPWWEPAAAIFSEVSTWVVVPIVISLIVGKSLDAHFGTKPWMFLGLTLLAFIVSIFGIVKVVRKYMEKIKDESKNN
ncbi:AtpZ/AtpI family protein [Patescibacteria group bacterium]|nr:AtpZ/AtpI family protein [Patescibacteria group bacterium]